MAAVGEEEEYESDPEDSLLPSAMRRREASDDEDGDASDVASKPSRKDPRAGIGCDGDSDDQGGAPAYEDNEEFDSDEEEEEEEELAVEEGGDALYMGKGEHDSPAVIAAAESGRDGRRSGSEEVGFEGDDRMEEEEVEMEMEAEKKGNEPYAVPTAGAFYMHDDRFRDNGRGRHRRMLGGRRLWESKDDRAWVHDRFEEMNLRDARIDEGRRTRGRGIGKTRGTDHRYGTNDRPRAYHDGGNNHVPKIVRGRGPRRYEPSLNNKSGAPAIKYRQYAKPRVPTVNHTVGRQSSQNSNVQHDPQLSRKHVASSLSSASPPFYPSGSSNQESSVSQRRDAQSGSSNKAISSNMKMEKKISAPLSGSLLKGKSVFDPVGHDRLYMDGHTPPVSRKNLVSPQLQSSGYSRLSPSSTQSSNNGVHVKGLNNTGLSTYQQTLPLNQVHRVSSQIHPLVVQQRPAQASQPASRTVTQQLGQRPGGVNQISYSPETPLSKLPDVGETNSPSGLSRSKTPSVGVGKTHNQGPERGMFLYNGAQVIGAAGTMGLPHGDQGFSATPALLPVMQFGGQNHSGIAVGMALPGYVAQPQLGFGNSELTWLPLLSGGAGGLGACNSPYVALDSNNYPLHPSGQTSSSDSSRETNTIKDTSWKSPHRPEIVNDEFGQRQNKPRRYSEMNFGQ